MPRYDDVDMIGYDTPEEMTDEELKLAAKAADDFASHRIQSEER